MILLYVTVPQLLAIGFLWGVQLTCLSLYWASDLKLAFRDRKHRRSGP